MTDNPAETWRQLRAEIVVYEDDDVLVINKPVGVSVVGERHDTDIVQMAKDAGEYLNPAHRIDKVTSGVVALAKSASKHGFLTRQFAKRTVSKQYLAVVVGDRPPAPKFTVDLPLRTASSGRVRVSAPRESIRWDQARSTFCTDQVDPQYKSFPSVTEVEVVSSSANTSLVSLNPLTGRRHQIRVHLAWIGFPVAGDPLFKTTSGVDYERTLLHSFRLSIKVPSAPDQPMVFEAMPGPDFIGHEASDFAELIQFSQLGH